MTKLMNLPTLAASLCMTEAEVLKMVEDGEIPRARSGKWDWQSVDDAMTGGKLDRQRVYFLEMGEFIKIGRSSDIRRRIQSFEGFLPLPTKLLHQIPGTCDTETDLHRKFKHLRTKGEWFRATDELRGFIASLIENGVKTDAQ